MIGLGFEAKQEIGRGASTRVENDELAHRQRGRAMLRFRLTTALKKIASVGGSIANHLPHVRHLIDPTTDKEHLSVALTDWHSLTT